MKETVIIIYAIRLSRSFGFRFVSVLENYSGKVEFTFGLVHFS